ncbi:MAG: transcription antitermination factor NusB [Flavobacteriales bacterium]|nr:transcription antitermination factor NusB [Flavobacteriales bacterium]NQX97585.1 transcription antitermination factor NusB [Flavobacteriales bacterium]
MKKLESETFLSLERMHDLYLFFLILGQELTHLSELRMEEAKKKRLPTDEDLNPNTKFIENKVLALLAKNVSLKKQINDNKLSWSKDKELMIKFSAFVREHELFKEYMSTRETSFAEDKKFVIDLYKKIIPDFELLLSEIEDKSIFWGLDEMDFVLSMIIKTIKRFSEDSTMSEPLLPLYRDTKEDKQFVRDLLSKVVENDKANSQLIAAKTKNWDVERIAMVDILLMKLALTEFIYFKSVPVKVTLNEYIELSKWYSTPKSKVFVNGVLDKLVLELKESGELKKMGRGLLEN